MFEVFPDISRSNFHSQRLEERREKELDAKWHRKIFWKVTRGFCDRVKLQEARIEEMTHTSSTACRH